MDAIEASAVTTGHENLAGPARVDQASIGANNPENPSINLHVTAVNDFNKESELAG